MEETEEERDLGVWLDSTLKPGLQCQTAAMNANRTLGLILRTFHYRTKETLVPLFKSLVRPKLEFAVASWNPWLTKDIDCLEKVQRRMIKSLSNVRGSTYEERLMDVGLTSLAERRQRGDMMETYKSLNGVSNVKKEDWFNFPDDGRANTRSNTVIGKDGEERRSIVIERERAKLDVRANSFRIRAAKRWNELPDEVRSAKSLNAFKNAYDSWNETISNEQQ